MEKIRELLDIIKESQSTESESKCMQDYCDAMIEVQEMKKEISQFKGQVTKSYKLKIKRVSILENAIHSFYKSYFDMAKYKEMYVKKKQELIEKEINFLCSIAKTTKA